MGIPNIVKGSTGGSWRVEGWRCKWTLCRFLGSEAVERGEVFIKHCRGKIQKWKMNVFMSCCSHINPQNFCQAQKRILEGVRRAEPCKRPTAKHLSVRECTDELRVLVPSFICRDEQGLQNLGKRKRETGHKGTVERGGMKEWEKEKASQWGFLSNVKVRRPTKLFLPGKSYVQIPAWKSLRIPGWSESQWAQEVGQGLSVSGQLHMYCFLTRMLFQPSSLTIQHHFSWLVSPFGFIPVHTLLQNNGLQTVCARVTWDSHGVQRARCPNTVRFASCDGRESSRENSLNIPFSWHTAASVLLSLLLFLKTIALSPKQVPNYPRTETF